MVTVACFLTTCNDTAQLWELAWLIQFQNIIDKSAKEKLHLNARRMFIDMQIALLITCMIVWHLSYYGKGAFIIHRVRLYYTEGS